MSIYGAKGLAWVKVNELEKGAGGFSLRLSKFLGTSDHGDYGSAGRCQWRHHFFGADRANVVNESMGALRVKLGHDLGLLEKKWAPLWVVDFNVRGVGRWLLTAIHHPFTSPSCSPEDLLTKPAKALSKAYDMVLNGTELGGGSIRIHDGKCKKPSSKFWGLTKKPKTSLVSCWML